MGANRTSTILHRFGRYLVRAERSPATVRNYLSDLRGFAEWFRETNDLELAPQEVTITDLQGYKRHILQRPVARPGGPR